MSFFATAALLSSLWQRITFEKISFTTPKSCFNHKYDLADAVYFSSPPWSQSRSTISSENKLTLMTLIDISNPRGDSTKSKLEFLPDDWFSLSHFQATIFVGISLLGSNVITLLVANKMPRRLMLILSSFGISGALIGMGVYFHFKSLELEACGPGISAENCEDIYTHSIRYTLYIWNKPSYFLILWNFLFNFRWLPLLLLMIYIFFFNLGYGAMIWITVVEILPLHVRSVATSLSVAFTCVCSFLTSHTYSDLKEKISVEGVFWLYGSISFAGLLFILIFIPETKGKTATELRDYFTKRSRKPTVKERKTMTQQRAAKMQ